LMPDCYLPPKKRAGTKEIMLDMYQEPDKLLKALEAMTPLMIKMGVSGAKRNTAYTIDTYQAEVVIPEERL